MTRTKGIDWDAVFAASQGVTATEIARAYGVTFHSVSVAAKRRGIQLRKGASGRKPNQYFELVLARLDADYRAAVIALQESSQFCRKHGIGNAVLQKLERRHGVKLPRTSQVGRPKGWRTP